MDPWVVVIGAFIVLLPIVLALDFWGDERLNARGRPIPRAWPSERRAERVEDDATHGG